MAALGYPEGEPEVLLGPAGEAGAGRRAGPPLEADRQRHHAGRHPRRGRSRRRAASRSCCRASTPRRPSTSTSSPRSRWRTPSTTCSTRTRASRRSVARRSRSVSPGCRCSTRRWLRSCTSASSSSCARSRRTRVCSRRPPSSARRTGSPRGCATSPRRSTASTATAASSPTTPRSRRPGSGWREACRLGLADALAILGVHAPDEMSAARRSRRRRARAVNPAAPLALGLLPRTATVDADGRLAIDGCDLELLAREHGTPLYVYDEDRAAGACREYGDRLRRRRSVLRGQGVPLHARWRAWSPRRGSTSTWPPAASSHVALHAGFPPARIVFHGNNKSEAELQLALDAGVGRIVADSFDELDRIEALVGAGPRAPRSSCGSRPASRRTPTSTSPPAPTTRSSGSPSRTAVRVTPRSRVAKSDGDAPRRLPLPHRVADPRARVVRPGRGGRRRAGGRRRPRDGRRRFPRSTWAAGSACPTPPTSSTPRASPSSDAARANVRRRVPRAVELDPAPALTVEAGPLDRRARRGHAVHGRHHQGDPGGAHLRRGRRRDERQPASGDLRRRPTRRVCPARIAAARPVRRHGRRQALRAGRPARAATRTCRPTSRSATCWSRRSPARTATRWRRNYNLVPRPAVVFVRDGRRPGGGAARDDRRSRRTRRHRRSRR